MCQTEPRWASTSPSLKLTSVARTATSASSRVSVRCTLAAGPLLALTPQRGGAVSSGVAKFSVHGNRSPRAGWATPTRRRRLAASGQRVWSCGGKHAATTSWPGGTEHDDVPGCRVLPPHRWQDCCECLDVRPRPNVGARRAHGTAWGTALNNSRAGCPNRPRHSRNLHRRSDIASHLYAVERSSSNDGCVPIRRLGVRTRSPFLKGV